MRTVNEAKQELHKLLKPGDRVYTILQHVSRSGMARDISTIIVNDNRLRDITYLVADLLQFPRRDDGSVRVFGCGMDMGFSLVYDLGATLWPEGFEGEHGNDGGYALNREWL